MTYAEHQKKANEIRQVFDEDTGRIRLIRGKGEILESIVSYKQQKRINKNATYADGLSFSKAAARKMDHR